MNIFNMRNLMLRDSHIPITIINLQIFKYNIIFIPTKKDKFLQKL